VHVVQLSPEQFEAIIERAAERGAAKALDSIGLGDEHANRDVVELRSWIGSVRDAKSTMFKVMITSLTLALIALVGLGGATKLLNFLSGGGGGGS
jgi:hypothetical protein